MSKRCQAYSRSFCRRITIALTLLILPTATARADSDWLYGIHWWGWTGSLPTDDVPAQMLDCPTYGGWDLETILTHDASWWRASYFTGLYGDLYANRNVTIITRIDYKWGETVPSPSNPDYANWATSVVNTVNTLRNWCHIWVIGNEPNIVGEGDNWPNSEVTPSGYATIYRNVRNAIHASAQPSPAGPHVVCVAPPSPGGVIGGIRWMDGNQWLGQVIDNIPNSEIDGFAIHAYGGSITDFHNSYANQLALIDSKGLQYRPVYMTEWNKVSTEAAMAQFVRDAYADVHNWNQTPGNHDIVCLCWFVYDNGGGWNDYSIEYYRTTGEPLGSPNDLYTAFAQTVDLRYPAGDDYLTPVIEATPASLVHTVFEGDDLADDTITVRNAGQATLNYTVADNRSWMSVAPGSGSSTGEPDTITVHYDVAGLAQGGPYNGLITVSGNADNSPQTVTVSVTVAESPYAPADFDRDTDVDAADYEHFSGCATGAGQGPPGEGCDNADLDGDGDVDQDDYADLQVCFSGNGVEADKHCAD